MSPVPLDPTRTPAPARRSLVSVSATAALAAVTHAYDFGLVAFLVGAITIAVLSLLIVWAGRSGSRIALVLYALLALWIIVGFGLVGGFWNHTVKVVVATAAGGVLPSGLTGLFMSPALGGLLFEGSGILTFVACLVGAYESGRYVRAALRRSVPSP